MESIRFQHNALTAAEITTRRLCRLHRVRLFSPALCRVKRGSKVIVQGESRVLATPQQLIVLPADVELEVINQPENGLFCSDLLSLTPELLTRFKTRYLSEPPPGRLTSLCAPVTTELAFMWQSVLQAVREGLSVALQQDLSAQVRQLIMLSPAQAWSVSRVAKMLFLGESTLRRRLQQESQSFRQIVEEVRMAHALGQLQTTSRPIGEIAQNSGYQSGSRFTARFRQHYGLLPKHVR
ncbi:helix-turn-helix transcriptional regulator [Klebsiella pneumoniae]|uniref:helix-turn-helix transcriptional regulator n=1 Tax=Klebsiella pneumoniae TaxID=573 RepID=UPI001CBFE7AC|nr:helix-turn-helix transcriptional regulator [Klebsiella pneumoniae]MBZ1946668.1 helix-turn-helix transcriptional regulator [Klebsiella pneumoniae]